MEDIVERGYVIIGSPDEVVEQLTEVATDLNVGHLMLLLQFGNMGKDLAKYNTKLFAEQVMPKLRGLFSEWEDRWWPAPMAQAERAEPARSRPPRSPRSSVEPDRVKSNHLPSPPRRRGSRASDEAVALDSRLRGSDDSISNDPALSDRVQGVRARGLRPSPKIDDPGSG